MVSFVALNPKCLKMFLVAFSNSTVVFSFVPPTDNLRYSFSKIVLSNYPKLNSSEFLEIIFLISDIPIFSNFDTISIISDFDNEGRCN
jgi:hypothetical protein